VIVQDVPHVHALLGATGFSTTSIGSKPVGHAGVRVGAKPTIVHPAGEGVAQSHVAPSACVGGGAVGGGEPSSATGGLPDDEAGWLTSSPTATPIVSSPQDARITHAETHAINADRPTRIRKE
jgi:hypothetical protein